MDMSKDKNDFQPGVGLDIGTMNFVSARRSGKSVSTNRVRNAFLDMPPEHKRMLKLSNTSYVELQNKLLVIGDEALETANLFNKEARRPMSGGVISAGELDSQQVIGLIIKSVVGEPKKAREKCCYSVPAAAVDVPGSDITYHSKILGKILEEIGYSADPVNEALAVVFSECAPSNFTGLGISYGSGMTNICLSYNAMSVLEFSLGRGGDWVDAGAARALGLTSARICSIKESGVDINNPTTRESEAIAVYLDNLIDYSINQIISHFGKVRNDIMINKPLPIIVSGGTSLANGFLDKFKARFNNLAGKFPFPVSEIRAAKDPLTAVATGLLVVGQMDD
jgi:hypothetical protein